MLKLISLLTILLTINIALAAEADELEISLMEYNPETQQARIKIGNIGSRNLYDLVLSVNGKEQKFDGLLLRPISQGGGYVVLPRIVPPGTYTVTAKTKEGVIVEKELLFPKSQEQVKKEVEEKRKEEAQKEIEEEKEPEKIISPITEKPFYLKSITRLIIVIAIIVALVFTAKFLKKRKNV